MKNKISIGSWITINHYSIAEIMADAGFDWLCIDLEHSVTDFSEAQQMILAIQSKGIKAFVRVGGNDRIIIKRVLDAGADGIIVPSINNKKEALDAISHVKYPPFGQRGVGLSRAQGYGFDFENYKNNKAKNIVLIAQIEHVDAIENLREIVELDGIDGTLIGPYDLSGSMGKPGMWNDSDVQAALEKYIKVVKLYDKLIGFHVIEPDFKIINEKINLGYNFISFSLDSVFLGTIIRKQLKKLIK